MKKQILTVVNCGGTIDTRGLREVINKPQINVKEIREAVQFLQELEVSMHEEEPLPLPSMLPDESESMTANANAEWDGIGEEPLELPSMPVPKL